MKNNFAKGADKGKSVWLAERICAGDYLCEFSMIRVIVLPMCRTW